MGQTCPSLVEHGGMDVPSATRNEGSCYTLGVKSGSRKLGVAAVSAVLLLMGTSCELSNFNVREMHIDSGLHLIPVGPRWLGEPSDPGSYYFFFHTATGFTTVNHF